MGDSHFTLPPRALPVPTGGPFPALGSTFPGATAVSAGGRGASTFQAATAAGVTQIQPALTSPGRTLFFAGVRSTWARGTVEIIRPERLGQLRLTNGGVLFFDFDDTLWTGFPNKLEAHLWAAWIGRTDQPEELAVAFIESFLQNTLGFSFRDRIGLLRDQGIDLPEDVDAFNERRRRAIDLAIEQEGYADPRYLVPGVSQLLEIAAKSVTLEVITGGSGEARQRYAETMGIAPHFRLFHGGGRKTERIQARMAELGLTIDQVAIVEDGPKVIRTAHEAGIVTIGFAPNAARRLELIEAGADMIIHGSYARPGEILQALGIQQDGLEGLGDEPRAFINQWNRISRGFGVGMFPTSYDPEMANNLLEAVGVLRERVPSANAYNRFSNLLTTFTLDIVNPERGLSEGDIARRTEEIVAAVQEIKSSLLYVNACAVLFETFGKLGLDASLLVNDRQDLVRDALERVETISPDENTTSGKTKAQTRGNYDQLVSYAQLFVAIGHLGMKDVLLERNVRGETYIERSLRVIDDVPSPFARGRYAPVLFSALKVLGFDGYIFNNGAGKNYLTELLDYVDDEANQAIDANLSTTPNYRRAYPLLLSLIGIGILGRKDDVLYRGRDRIEEARVLLDQLTPEDDIAKMVTLYLVALLNLGELDEKVPDREAFIRRHLPKAFAKIDKNTGYVIELLAVNERLDLLPEGLIPQWIASLTLSGAQPITRIPPYTAALMLGVLGQLGHDQAQLMFEPNTALSGDRPFPKFLRDLTANPEATEQFLPMIHHAMINYALRMRGA